MKKIILLFLMFEFSAYGYQCGIAGNEKSAPKLCGAAQQGGLLYGDSDMDVFAGDEKISNNGIFVLGLSMDAPEKIELQFCKKENCGTFSYKVKQRKYIEQKVTVPSKFTKYPADIEERIARESSEIKQARGLVAQDTETFFTDFEIPDNLKDIGISGTYGNRRIFNGVPKSPHKGTDWAAAKGTHVYPFGRGRVVLTGNHYMNGNIVIVSHGYGITTAYLHLDKIDVEIGDKVDKKTVLGTVGDTGRASGPHLHAQMNFGEEALDLELVK